MLAAFKMFVSDYELSPQATVNRDLDKQLRPQIQHLIDCRPHSASMGAAIKKLRQTIAALPPETSAADAKGELREAIDAYVQERIVLPGKVISKLLKRDTREKFLDTGKAARNAMAAGDEERARAKRAAGHRTAAAGGKAAKDKMGVGKAKAKGKAGGKGSAKGKKGR